MCKAKLALVWLGRSLPACHRADCHEMTCVRDAHIANTRQSPPPPPKQPYSRAQRRPKIVDNVWALSCLCQHSACACAARRRFSAPHRRRRSSFAARCAWRGRIAVRVLSRGAVWSAVRRCFGWFASSACVWARPPRASGASGDPRALITAGTPRAVSGDSLKAAAWAEAAWRARNRGLRRIIRLLAERTCGVNLELCGRSAGWYIGRIADWHRIWLGVPTLELAASGGGGLLKRRRGRSSPSARVCWRLLRRGRRRRRDGRP